MLFYLPVSWNALFITRTFSTNEAMTESSNVKYFFSHAYCLLFKCCYDFEKEKTYKKFTAMLSMPLREINSAFGMQHPGISDNREKY